MADTILIERDGAIATVVLNRPEKLNALTKSMWQRLGKVFVVLEGRVFDAREALAKRLVTRVVPDAEVAAEAQAAAQRIAAGAPLVARWHKRFARRLRDPAPLSQAEIEEGYACFGSEDFRIGYQAFLAKITPEFKGR